MIRCPLCFVLLPEHPELHNFVEEDENGEQIRFDWIPCCKFCQMVASTMKETRILRISAAKIIRSRVIFQ